MTGPRFRAEPDKLHAQATDLHELSAEMTSIVSSLQSKLAGEGAPWSGDEPGTQFSSSYLPQKDRVDAAMQAQVQFLEGNAEALRTAADTAEHL